MGILIAITILLTIILSCEAILKYNKSNGVVQEVFSSTFMPDHVNIVTHVLHKGVEVRNFSDLVPEYHVKYVRLEKFKKAKRFYKAYKHRNKS